MFFFVCVFLPHIILDVRLVDVPPGVTQEEGHTRCFIHLPSAVLALVFLARRIQPFLSLVDREVEICVQTILNVLHYSLGIFFFFFFCEAKSQLPGFELTSQCVRRFRGYQLNHRGDLVYIRVVVTTCCTTYYAKLPQCIVSLDMLSIMFKTRVVVLFVPSFTLPFFESLHPPPPA